MDNNPALEALNTQVAQAAAAEQQKSLAERARERGEAKREESTQWIMDAIDRVDMVIGIVTEPDLRQELVDNVAAEIGKTVDEAVDATVELGHKVGNKVVETVDKVENKIVETGKSIRDKAVELYKGSVNGVARVVAAPIYEGVNKTINGIEGGAKGFVMELKKDLVNGAGELVYKGGNKVVEVTLAQPVLEVRSMANALAERGSSNFVDRAMARVLGRVAEVRSKAFEAAEFGNKLRFAAAEIRNAKGAVEASARNKDRATEATADRMRAGIV